MGDKCWKDRHKIWVEGVLDKDLDNDGRTATTANFITLVGDLSESDSEDEENFAAENRLASTAGVFVIQRKW